MQMNVPVSGLTGHLIYEAQTHLNHSYSPLNVNKYLNPLLINNPLQSSVDLCVYMIYTFGLLLFGGFAANIKTLIVHEYNTERNQYEADRRAKRSSQVHLVLTDIRRLQSLQIRLQIILRNSLFIGPARP